MEQGYILFKDTMRAFPYNEEMLSSPHIKDDEWRFITPLEVKKLDLPEMSETHTQTVVSINLIDVKLITEIPKGDKQQIIRFFKNKFPDELINPDKSFIELKKEAIEMLLDHNKRLRDRNRDLSWMPSDFYEMTKNKLGVFAKEKGVEEAFVSVKDEVKSVVQEAVIQAITENLD